jgi:sugar phosphate isomerase/epimerase
MKLLPLLTLLAAATLAAAPVANPFFVFDNGLRGEGLTTIPAQLDFAKSVGFDGLSWRTDAPERVKEVLAGARERGLRLFVVYANLDLKDGRLVYDPRLKEIVALCRDTGAMLWPTLTSKQFKYSDPAGDDIAVAGLRELADFCAGHGVRIALYPHVNMWAFRLEDTLRLVQKVGRPNVGLTFNLCHALMDGAEDRIPALLEAAAPHLFVVTINGTDSHPAKKTWLQLIQPLGRGSYDVGIVLRQLRALGYRGPIGLQCYDIKEDPRVFLPASMAAWRRLSAELK